MPLRKVRRFQRTFLISTIVYVVVFAQIPFFTARSAPPLIVDFTPISAVIGNVNNFTAVNSCDPSPPVYACLPGATGGTPPYTYSWNFGDGSPNGTGAWVLHRYNLAGTYAVSVTVTDSATGMATMAHSVTIFDWPVRSYNWLVHWNKTLDDGINIWNASYKGTLLIRDVRLPYVINNYRDNFCGPFQDEPYRVPDYTQIVIDRGHLSYGNFTTASDPYFQIFAEYDVGGYYYHEAFRFYASGRWEPEIDIGRGGCTADHIYNPMWRIDIGMGGAGNDFMSQYTTAGMWRDLIWEGSYVDNGFGDPLHNSAQWRIGDQGMYYYMVPSITRVDTDLPYLYTTIDLVRAHPDEIQNRHGLTCIPVPCEDPSEFINGELTFRRDIVIWFLPHIWDHGPIDNTSTQKVATLSFYPGGTWP